VRDILKLFVLVLLPTQGVATSSAAPTECAGPISFQETKARAETGDAMAEAELGHLYDFGQGIRQDYAEATKWYRKAAEQGVASAQFDLSLCYFRGHGTAQDYAEGMKWYRKAAEGGIVVAQYNLGLRYSFGMGVPKDAVEACKWFDLAAAQTAAGTTHNDNGIFIPKPGSTYYLVVNNCRNELIHSMTPAQLVESQRLSRELLARQAGGPSKRADARKLASSSQTHFQ
jgi:hypothetical protein